MSKILFLFTSLLELVTLMKKKKQEQHTHTNPSFQGFSVVVCLLFCEI